MPRVPAPGQLNRKIHFFRADCGADDDGRPITFQPKHMLEHIDELPFDDSGRYLTEDDITYCAFVDKAAMPSQLRFASIRRDGLPYVEERGLLTALDIPDTAGLVEQIHVQFFPHNIVGCDFNFYGPRLPRLRRYLDERGGPESQDVAFEPLARRDVLELLNRFDGIRLFNFRVRRADIDLIAQADASLAAALRAQATLGDAEEFEIVLRPKPYSREDDLGNRVFSLVRNLARRGDVLDAARAFRVEGRITGHPSQPLNILDEHLVSEQSIAKIPGRARAIDSTSAYAAIRAAERELRDALQAAVAIVGGQT